MKTSRVLFTFLVLATVTGCGPMGNRYIHRAPKDSIVTADARAVTIDTSNSPADATCPNTANIEPDYDWDFNGSGFFTVCTSKTSAYQIYVHGKTNTSNKICVFPAQYIDETHLYLKPDEYGRPLSICANVDDVVSMTFDKIIFNAAYIVEGHNEAQMRSCLTGGKYFECPAYSYGRFR